MEFQTLTNLDDAVEFSVKRVLPDADAVISWAPRAPNKENARRLDNRCDNGMSCVINFPITGSLIAFSY